VTALLVCWLGLASAIWGLLLLGVHRWGRRWTLEAEEGRGRVRVCVPARDEEGRIGPCVEAILGSDHRDLELVVVDDESTDDTAAEAWTALAGDPRGVVRPSAPRPPGWSGKAWACAQAARDADGDWLLFLDADVVVHPRAVGSAVAAAGSSRAALLSLFGTWSLHGFWERVCIPAIGWLVRGAVDLERVNDDLPGSPAFANGQFLLADRSAYVGWGGHEPVRDQVLDDVRLAEHVRSQGGRIRLLHAPWAFEVRLYRGLAEIVAGYRKNFYEGLGRRPVIALVAVASVFATSVLPVLAAPALVGCGRPLLGSWAVGVTLASMAYRVLLERRDGRSGWVGPLHPVGAAVLCWVLLASMVSREVHWKGRRFTGGTADD